VVRVRARRERGDDTYESGDQDEVEGVAFAEHVP
jgi:hypothetical protein